MRFGAQRYPRAQSAGRMRLIGYNHQSLLLYNIFRFIAFNTNLSFFVTGEVLLICFGKAMFFDLNGYHRSGTCIPGLFIFQ
jgi:hypothetical protein